ncbi:hypothetical protein [Lysinibacillus pakistanensis]|uniref:Transposase n=1 Tax=Lysinibacillus pakistanensis TaxID=759811 RepID=A0AAX3WP07_9BACI|nr:hypothetical protein [Lysinibacillus pakistanensis]MDM5233791.1 hypothetical protein [Lysinibacillus pakistanensis]WHY44410.1 hypothetical protein QNH22_13820 [Lysinibacillus pakistanensis]WHY49419.1 hypothetical protein QNH24_13800 [Lysinibacillus pakistanensis]
MEQNLYQRNYLLIKDKNTQGTFLFKSFSEKGITYTDEFKAIAIAEYEKGKCSHKLFEDVGCHIDQVGIHRAKSALTRWRAV